MNKRLTKRIYSTLVPILLQPESKLEQHVLPSPRNPSLPRINREEVLSRPLHKTATRDQKLQLGRQHFKMESQGQKAGHR